MKHQILLVVILLAAFALSAQEIPLRKAWKLDWKGTQVRTADNCVIALWEDTDAGDTDIWAQKFNPSGMTQWAEPRLIVSEPGVQEILECKPTSDNNFVLLYQQSGYGYVTSLRAQKFTSNGQPLWGEGGVLVRNGQVTACLTPNAIGGAYVVFRSTSQTISGQNLDSFGNQLWPADGLLLASHTSIISLDGSVSDGEGGLIINARKLVNSLSITELSRYSPQGTVIGPNPLLPAGAFPGYVYTITPDAFGNFVLWNVNTPNINGLILHKMDSSGNLLLDAPLVSNLDIFTAGYNKPSLQTVSDGGLMFCYEVLSPDDNREMRVLRFDDDYEPVWGNNGVEFASGVSQNGLWMQLSQAVTDAGGAWFDWINFADDDQPQQLRAQYVSPTGEIPWGINGIALSTEASDFRIPVQVSFADRAMFLWQDQLGPDNAIRRQVLSTGGAPFFALGGEPVVSRLAGIALGPEVVALQDRYLVLWQDIRNGWYNLYYQLCNANMNPLLEPNGRPLFSEPMDIHMTDTRVLSMPDNSVALLYRGESHGTNLPYYLQMIDAQGNTVYPGYGLQIAQTGDEFQFSLSGNDLYIGWLLWDDNHTYLMGQRVSNGQALWEPDGKVLATLPQGTGIISDLVGMRDRYFILNTWDWDTDNNGILVLRFDPNGDPEPGWPAQGIEAFSANAQIDDYSPSNALLDGDLLLFSRYHPTLPRAQRISQTGTKLWGEDGIQLPQMAMQNILDADDGPVILYSGQFEPQDLRLQKIDENGNLLYGESGHLVAENLFNCWDANLLKFSSGAMACVWSNYSSYPYGYRDVFIRHINPQGEAIGISADILCNAWLEQEHVHAAAIGNSALVTWSDGRAGILDSENFVNAIYATRITSAWVENSDPEVPSLIRPVLHQNFPNPFNPETTITFSLPQAGNADLAIYNQKGQLVRDLHLEQELPAGDHTVVWDGRDANGDYVGSGIYLYRLNCMGKSITRKMVLMK